MTTVFLILPEQYRRKAKFSRKMAAASTDQQKRKWLLHDAAVWERMAQYEENKKAVDWTISARQGRLKALGLSFNRQARWESRCGAWAPPSSRCRGGAAEQDLGRMPTPVTGKHNLHSVYGYGPLLAAAVIGRWPSATVLTTSGQHVRAADAPFHLLGL